MMAIRVRIELSVAVYTRRMVATDLCEGFAAVGCPTLLLTAQARFLSFANWLVTVTFSAVFHSRPWRPFVPARSSYTRALLGSEPEQNQQTM